MTRSFLDQHLMEWEAFASTPRGGLPSPGRILFRCLSDRTTRTRYHQVEGTRSDAEARIQRADEGELRELLEGSEEMS